MVDASSVSSSCPVGDGVPLVVERVDLLDLSLSRNSMSILSVMGSDADSLIDVNVDDHYQTDLPPSMTTLDLSLIHI